MSPTPIEWHGQTSLTFVPLLFSGKRLACQALSIFHGDPGHLCLVETPLT